MHQTADRTAPVAPLDLSPDVVPCWPGAAPVVPDTSLVGRDADLAALLDLALHGAPSFITLVGAGGVGKSRLAAELSQRSMARHGGRTAVVPLDAVSDASMVLPAIAGALGVADEPGRSLSEALAGTLGTEPSLLVLDTVEHVRPAAPALADLRERSPGLTIVATSRVTLGVPRERVVWIEPLPVPAEGEPDPVALVANPSAALFLERARAVRPDLDATPGNASLIAAICRRLDGIPLAIELAAAALRVIEPHQLLAQLAERLADAGTTGGTTGSADVTGPGRQRSLRAAMDWSIGLLGPEVLRLYRRVAVIAGPFSPATAASILERGERRGLAPVGIAVHEGLEQLAGASLLRREDEGRAYALLTTIRADALDRLAASGELVAMRWAHAYEVLDVVERSERDLPTEREVEALDRLDEAHDDIREALDWATEAGDGPFAVRMTGALAEFWRTRGHHTEGRLRLAAALALAHDAPAAYRRRALAGAGLLASWQGDYTLAEAYLREALAVARAERDEEAMAVILNWLGTNSYGRGDLDASETHISESLALRRRLGDPAGIAAALNALGGVHHFRGDLDLAREMFTESLTIKQGLANENSIAVSLTNLGLVERDAGRPEVAAGAFEEAIAIWERTGDRQRVAVGLHNSALVSLDLHRHDEAAVGLGRALAIARDLGDRTEQAYALADLARVDVERGRLDEAAASLAEALPRAAALGARIIVPLGLEAAGSLAAARGEDGLAVRLWGAAATERRSSGFANMPADERHLDERLDLVRGRLDPADFAAAWAEGSALAAGDATALAHGLVHTPQPPRG